MKKSFRDLLDEWPRMYIHDRDLARLLKKSDDARYALVKRAIKSQLLIRLRKGLYLIASALKRVLPDEFELALLIYEPSIISLESALSRHGWIPEAVYTTTCTTPKRAQEFKNRYGLFKYVHVPAQGFFNGVARIQSATGIMMLADPWRALADFMYSRHASWKSLADLEADLRIDQDTACESDVELLKDLCERYPSARVRKGLKVFLKEIQKRRS